MNPPENQREVEVSEEAVELAYQSLDGEQLKWLASVPPGRKAIARKALQAAAPVLCAQERERCEAEKQARVAELKAELLARQGEIAALEDEQEKLLGKAGELVDKRGWLFWERPSGEGSWGPWKLATLGIDSLVVKGQDRPEEYEVEEVIPVAALPAIRQQAAQQGRERVENVDLLAYIDDRVNALREALPQTPDISTYGDRERGQHRQIEDELRVLGAVREKAEAVLNLAARQADRAAQAAQQERERVKEALLSDEAVQAACDAFESLDGDGAYFNFAMDAALTAALTTLDKETD